jgi:hypothetical protein
MRISEEFSVVQEKINIAFGKFQDTIHDAPTVLDDG